MTPIVKVSFEIFISQENKKNTSIFPNGDLFTKSYSEHNWTLLVYLRTAIVITKKLGIVSIIL